MEAARLEFRSLLLLPPDRVAAEAERRVTELHGLLCPDLSSSSARRKRKKRRQKNFSNILSSHSDLRTFFCEPLLGRSCLVSASCPRSTRMLVFLGGDFRTFPYSTRFLVQQWIM